MDHEQTPEERQTSVRQSEDRLRAVALRMSQAQELMTVAKQRLDQARLALEHARSKNTDDSPADDDPMKATDTP